MDFLESVVWASCFLQCAEACWGPRASKQRGMSQLASGLPSNRCCLPIAGPLCRACPVVGLMFWEWGAGTSSLCPPSPPILASLPLECHSSLPPGHLLQGGLGWGGWGRAGGGGVTFSAWRLAAEPKNDIGAFGSPMAEDKAAHEFEEHNKIFRMILRAQVYVVF